MTNDPAAPARAPESPKPDDPQRAEQPVPRKYNDYARLSYWHPERGTAYKTFLRHTTLLGSALDSHIRLLSPEIAPAHCVITIDGDVIKIRNLHHVHGTRVNGVEVQISRLAHGDTLEIGRFTFRVETNLTFELSKTASIVDTRIEHREEFPQSDSSSAAPPVAPPPQQQPPQKKGLTIEFLKSLMLQGLLTRFQADWLMTGEFVEFSIDRYRVTQILGTGGMGWLYVARDEQTGEKVALKVISKEQDNEYLTRFKLEARAGLMLKHPHIVRTDRIDETPDVIFVVMELVEGISLQELVILNKFIPWQQACSFARQAAEGLKHAHSKGMVHRDVKPANLLIEADGKVKILDFGLAMLEKDEDEFSLAMISGQDCVGTADYIAPEQTLDSFTVDARADIYSLGCTLYAALTGSVPFPAETVSQKLRAHRSKDPKPIRELRPEVPEAVEAIVRKMMARDLNTRYRTAAEVAKALAPYSRKSPAEFDFQAVLD
ncbi:MAG: FHA domain-containing serine/threonine-protein kinase, partial [Planctomycetaceae bacterium]